MKHYTWWAIALYAIVALFTFHNKRFYTQDITQLVHYDAMGYYGYLLLWWTDEDSDFDRLKALPHNTFYIESATTTDTTAVINKYSTGLAILHSPFFLIGDLQAYWQALPRDGLAQPYRYWTALGAIFYALLSLIFLRGWLRAYSSEGATAIALVGIGLGTHWWHYTLYEPFMAHHTSFCCFAALLYGADRWYQRGHWGWALWLGFWTGILTATRLPNLIIGLAILLGGVGSAQSARQRLQFFGRHWRALLGAGLMVLLVQVPQSLYWHAVTGFWLLNPYGINNEGFFWTEPRFLEVLIGYRKGWFIYTPMAIITVWGMRHVYQQQRDWFWAISGYLLLHLYLVATWGCWWYGGCFALRPMVESMAILSLPLAIWWDQQSHQVWRWASGTVVVALIVLNQFQSHQYQYGLIHYDAMTRAAYWHSFGKIPPASPEFYQKQQPLLLPPDHLAECLREKNASTIW